MFSLPVGTEMFHFPTFPPTTLYIQVQVTRHHSCWVSPFGHPRITARLTTPRGLSRPTTSFIGSWCQGIHRALLHTYNTTSRQNKKQRCSRPLCSSQTTHTNPTHTPATHGASGASGISATRNNQTPHRGSMVLFQTPNSVFRPGHSLPHPRPALSRRQ